MRCKKTRTVEENKTVKENKVVEEYRVKRTNLSKRKDETNKAVEESCLFVAHAHYLAAFAILQHSLAAS